MTTGPSAPHTDVIVTRLRAQAPPGVAIYDGQITDEPPPQAYVIVYPGIRTRDRSSMAVDNPDVTTFPQLTCVGVTREQAEAVTDWATRQLIGWRPSITGRSCGPVMFEAGQPATRDDAHRDPGTNQPRWYAVELLRVHSVPA